MCFRNSIFHRYCKGWRRKHLTQRINYHISRAWLWSLANFKFTNILWHLLSKCAWPWNKVLRITCKYHLFISVINHLDAQNFCFTTSLFHASTCFEHMCSEHVEAWNKLIVKQKFCASSWFITEINILRCTVSKTSKFANSVRPTSMWSAWLKSGLTACASTTVSFLIFRAGRARTEKTCGGVS